LPPYDFKGFLGIFLLVGLSPGHPGSVEEVACKKIELVFKIWAQSYQKEFKILKKYLYKSENCESTILFKKV
jgi:hypothetical protein